MSSNPFLNFDDVGTEDADFIPGSIGNDTIAGLGGDDVLTGSLGDDVLNGGDGADVLDGGDGDDFLEGGEGADVLIAQAGDDTLNGGAASDHYLVAGGTAGDEIFIVDTEGARDVMSARGATTSVLMDLRAGATTYVDGRTITLAGGTTVTSPLDLMLVQDCSGSFGDDVATVQALAPDLLATIQGLAPDYTVGVSSFVDKPTSPFGSPPDYEFQVDQGLSSTDSDFIDGVNGLTVLSGGDFPESQMTALLQVALRTAEVGWRGGSLKIVVLTTDAIPHFAGDHPVGDNNGDDVLDGPGNDGTGEDYPTIAQVRDALEAAGIIPIFAVTTDVTTAYLDLVRDLSRGAVVDLSSDSDDIVRVFEDAIIQATTTLIEVGVGGRESDEIIGNEANNDLQGRLGNDSLTGLTGDDDLDGSFGNDKLYGDEGNDSLYGGDGKDKLYGGDGDDLIDGGAANDKLYGGLDKDTFNFGLLHGTDKVFDFEDGIDSLDFSDTGLTFGDLTITGNATKTVITSVEGKVTLVGVDVALIDATDFQF